MVAKKLALTRGYSDVQAIDASGQVFRGTYVWADVGPALKKDKTACFVKCLVLPGSTREVFRLRQIEPVDPTGEEYELPSNRCQNVNTTIDPLDFPDIGMIPHTNDAATLDFLKQRYLKAQIYTEAKPLLVAINPFKDLSNATDAVIVRYRDASDPGKLPPHVFAIAREALENLHSVQKSQTIIVSGESGAGKTEATKQVMRYFAAAKAGTIDTRIQSAVLAANPVLEAFGNAKTLRNNNSSRFGRFMQLQVSKYGGIEFGSVRNFLLEKSRILGQDSNERGYHIFYQLLKGADPSLRQRLDLLPLTDYRCLNPHCFDAPGIDDLREWIEVKAAFESMRLEPTEVLAVLSIVSGVLLMGNVEIIAVEKSGMTGVGELHPGSRSTFLRACKLLFVDPEAVEESITTKVTIAGGQTVKSFWVKEETTMLRDSLAKAMYEKVFFWIVNRLNSTIEPPSGFRHFMGMLDIFGFEVFTNNSLEQLFINITNEMLQKNFIDAVFERETRLYREEGISSADLCWTTNDEVIEALTNRKTSLMASLEDQCVVTGGSDEKFLANAHNSLKGSSKVVKAKQDSHINFLVHHTIGEIPYNATGFVFKNRDVLRAELVEVVNHSSNDVAKALFKGVVVEKGKLPKGQLIGSQFLSQLGQLMELINSTEPHFIRCVKPNDEKAPLKFAPTRVIAQLHSLSILEALHLRNLGYSYRRPFHEFLLQYRFVNLGISTDKSLDPADAARKLLSSAGITAGWQVGKTMLFMKPEALKELGQRQKECLAAWTPLVVVLEALTKKWKYRKMYDKQAKGLVRVQARCRQIISRSIIPVVIPHFKESVAGWH